ncbi:uncharacterized protein [Dysidea avara]|uniref:uncharacterized protein n=1 Tax=Dysidea avara TaxID=196820 RepID=UPI00332BC3C3
MAFKEFPVWMEQLQLLHKRCIDEGVKVIQQLHGDLSPKMYNDVMSDFLQNNNNGDLSAFWMSYIDMVTFLLGLLRASREDELKDDTSPDFGNRQFHSKLATDITVESPTF